MQDSILIDHMTTPQIRIQQADTIDVQGRSPIINESNVPNDGTENTDTKADSTTTIVVIVAIISVLFIVVVIFYILRKREHTTVCSSIKIKI